MRVIKLIIVISLIRLGNFAYADDEASNVPFVKSSEYGRIYAKSVPNDYYGSEGKTFIYSVEKEEDQLLYAFDWYAGQIYLLGSVGSVIRLGPWARGHEPKVQDLAIGFYLDGKKLKEYSTLDIVMAGYNEPINVRTSISHYTVFEEIMGYRWVRNNIWAFDVKTHEDKILSFDVSTGKLRSPEEEQHDRLIGKVQDLKVSCYENSSQAANEDKYEHVLTIEEFKECIGGQLPYIPDGYRLILGTFFHEVQLKKSE